METVYYEKVKNEINTFIDEVYAPFLIHYVLRDEMEKYKNGESSLYGIIDAAGKTDEKEAATEALNVMLEFQKALSSQITGKRTELLNSVLNGKEIKSK